MNTPSNDELFGQGRSPERMERDAFSVTILMIMLTLLIIALTPVALDGGHIAWPLG